MACNGAKPAKGRIPPAKLAADRILYYMGLETQVADHRPKATTTAQQGSVETALQIANFTIVQH